MVAALAVVAVMAVADGCHRATSGAPSAAPAHAPGAAADAVPPRQPVAFPPEWSLRLTRGLAVGAHAMVASNSELASAAGVDVLRQGGNAVDAAVAVGFALAVTHPEAGNIGGGGFMVIRMADGRTAAFDYREVAPLAATPTMYIHADGTTSTESVVGARAVGVPGAVAGLTSAQQAFGRLPLRQVVAPALRLAREGFVVDSAFARSVANARQRITGFAGADVFFPGGMPPVVGTRFAQPALARTLALVADSGAAGFYHGTVAAAITDEMRADGGLITPADLARYRAVRRQPLEATYRGYTLLTMPPPSSGGVTLIETLNLLEAYDSIPPFGSVAYSHRLADAFQRAFVDRNGQLGDPAFVTVPVAHLTDKQYARQIRSTTAPNRATPTGRLASTSTEGTQTTHYSVVDVDGNAVATTTTLNDLYGSGVFVRGAGFFLNDEMDDFATRPGTPNMFGLIEGAQNAIAPGKRMLSSMSPTIVLDPAGGLLLVVGGRGGPRIITSTAQVILDVIDYHMSLADALSAPRIHHQALPDSIRYEPHGLTPAVRDSLIAMGHAVIAGGAAGTCAAVMRVAGGYEGAVDPRSPGGAVGY